MAVASASQGGCDGIMGWRLFTRTDGMWQSVEGLRAAPHLRVDGTRIVERREVHRRGDWSYCGGATGGEQERVWAWDGTALVASAWTQTVPARPKGEVARFPRGTGVSFFALRRFQCSMHDRRGLVFAECSYRRPPIKFGRVDAAGRLRTCDDIGPYYGCEIGDPGEGDIPYTLRANQSVIVGRFRCRAGRTSMRCTVVKTGRGFVLDRRGPRAVR
jgi:hypothetical protein